MTLRHLAIVPSTFPQRLRFDYSLVLLRQKQQKEITMPIISDEMYNFKQHYQHDGNLFLPPPERICSDIQCQVSRGNGNKPRCNQCKGVFSRTQKYRQWKANPDALGTTISFRGKVFFCEMKRKAATWGFKKVHANLTAPRLKKKRQQQKKSDETYQAKNVAEGRHPRQSSKPECDRYGNTTEQGKANKRASTLAFRNGKFDKFFALPEILDLHYEGQTTGTKMNESSAKLIKLFKAEIVERGGKPFNLKEATVNEKTDKCNLSDKNAAQLPSVMAMLKSIMVAEDGDDDDDDSDDSGDASEKKMKNEKVVSVFDIEGSTKLVKGKEKVFAYDIAFDLLCIEISQDDKKTLEAKERTGIVSPVRCREVLDNLLALAANEANEDEDDDEEEVDEEGMDTGQYKSDDRHGVPTSTSSSSSSSTSSSNKRNRDPDYPSNKKGSSTRRFKRALKRQKKEVPKEEVEKIIVLYQFGQEKEFFRRLFEILGEGYREKFELLCMGSAIRMLSGRNGAGRILGGSSKYPQSMTCLTFAICNGEIFQHTAKSDVAHQKRCWRALLLAYARENREVVLAYGR